MIAAPLNEWMEQCHNLRSSHKMTDEEIIEYVVKGKDHQEDKNADIAAVQRTRKFNLFADTGGVVSRCATHYYRDDCAMHFVRGRAHAIKAWGNWKRFQKERHINLHMMS